MNFGRIDLAALAALALWPAAAVGQDFRVDGTLGRLDEAAVQKAVADAGGAIESCFRDHAGTLRYVGGRVIVAARVARDGHVSHAQVVEGDLGAWPVEKCLVELARKLSFGKPQGGEAEVRIPLEFSAQGNAVAMDGDELAKTMRSLRGCGGAPKEAMVTAYVGAGGRVTSIGFAAEGKLGAGWCECAAARAKGWQLADPRGTAAKISARFQR